MRSADYRAVVSDGITEENVGRSICATYKGYLNNDEKQVVRLGITEDGISGLITEGEVQYFIEPAKNFLQNSPKGSHVFYQKLDVVSKDLHCLAKEVDDSHQSVSMMTSTSAFEMKSRHLEIATESDFEFYIRPSVGNDHNIAFNRILFALNILESVYISNFGISFKVNFQHIYSTLNQPISSSDISTLLNQFRNHWESNRTNIRRDVAHLFTGKDVYDGNNNGVAGYSAKLGAVCSSPSFAYSLSEAGYTYLIDGFFAGHEISHLFNARHEDGRSCGTVNGTLIVCPSSRNDYYQYFRCRENQNT
ncbi:MAG: hypothetical protein OHK0038_28130 [Flammeovirgaceae bacterium]